MSARSAVTLGAALLAMVLSACSSSGGASCGPGTCTGCCSASGLCDLGSTTAACGASGNACVSCSAGFDCVLGSCAPKVSNPDSGFTGSGTCVTTGCPSGQQCNQASGICEAHCPSGSNSECPQPGFCDQATKLCRCSPGSHLCGSTCSSNNSISTCGDRCSPCEANGGTATCDGTTCGITCSSNLKACGSTCATCPAQATSTSCDGESCVAQSCANGYLACQGTCSQCPTNAASTGCVGSQCSALGCFSGDHICSGQCVYSGDPDTCGTRCSPCPAPTAHGFPTCTTGQCGVTCNSGYTACGTECTTCPTGAGVATTTCSGTTCVAATCNAGYKVCAGNCAACPEGATATSCSGATCTATACGAGFTVSSGNCIGLRTLPEDALGSAAPVGVAHVDGGVPASAWDTSSSVKVAVLNPDGGLGTPSVRGNSNSRAVSFGADGTSTQHLLYVDSPFNGTNTLHHSSRPSGGAWTDEIAYTAPAIAILLDSSIAVTPSGDLRVLVSENGSRLIYLEKNAGTWTAPIQTPTYAPRYFDLTVDSQGVSHIVVPAASSIEYALGNAPTLTAGPSILTTSSANTSYPSIAVDSAGTVYVAFFEGGNIKLTTLSGTSWSTPTVVAPASSGSPTDLAIDGSGNLHLVFAGCGPIKCGLRYGIRVGTTWSFQTLSKPNLNFLGSITDVAVDAPSIAERAATAATISDGTFLFVP